MLNLNFTSLLFGNWFIATNPSKNPGILFFFVIWNLFQLNCHYFCAQMLYIHQINYLDILYTWSNSVFCLLSRPVSNFQCKLRWLSVVSCQFVGTTTFGFDVYVNLFLWCRLPHVNTYTDHRYNFAWVITMPHLYWICCWYSTHRINKGDLRSIFFSFFIQNTNLISIWIQTKYFVFLVCFYWKIKILPHSNFDWFSSRIEGIKQQKD